MALAGCSASKVTKGAAMSTPMVMSQSDVVAVQRPDLPDTRLIAWTPNDRLYRSVTIDFVTGMSQRSYLFSKPNQMMFRPMLANALDRAGLLARSPTEARYALQISFDALHANSVGVDFAGKSSATYNLVSRLTGDVVYSGSIDANFLVKYPELNEGDFALAYDISEPLFTKALSIHTAAAVSEGVIVELINNNDDLTDFFDGPIAEASQATWDDYNQAFIWTEGAALLLGPLEVLRRQLDPSNYIAFASDRNRPKRNVIGDREGYLSEGGFGARDGKERALQASERMLGQSITKFLIDLGNSEHVRYKVILPCTMNSEVQAMKRSLLNAGFSYRTEPCTSDRFDAFETGVGYSDYY